MYNKIILMGRITHDLELKTTPNGIAACQFRIAVDRNYQKKGEEKVTDFFNVACWRGTAEFVTKWFGKGRMILIEGEMQTRQYTDKNGNPATWYEVNAERVCFTGEKKDDAQPAAAPATQSYGTTQNASNVPPADFAASDADDYPF